MRLFVAITPPEESLADLERVATDLEALGDRRYRWALRAQWHVTLAFLGNVEEDLLPELRRRLQRAAHRHEPMWLSLEGGGAFGSTRQARVLWAGVAGDVQPLRDLARTVAAAARRSGIELGDSRFRPHITLARLREPTDVRPVVAALESYHGPGWEAAELQLIRSHLGQGEGRRSVYEVIDAWPLGTAAGSEG